jgi:hypothetical protein
MNTKVMFLVAASILALQTMTATAGTVTQPSKTASFVPSWMQGTWCGGQPGLSGTWVRDEDHEGCNNEDEEYEYRYTQTMIITSSGYRIGSDTCTAMQVNTFDVWLWGKKGPKNGYGPGYRIKFRCSSGNEAPEFYTQEWTTEKGSYLNVKTIKGS